LFFLVSDSQHVRSPSGVIARRIAANIAKLPELGTVASWRQYE
jgi:hypothetical protein